MSFLTVKLLTTHFGSRLIVATNGPDAYLNTSR